MFWSLLISFHCGCNSAATAAKETEPSQDYLPPSVRESIQNILANGAFFTHKSPVVLLPPPIGLFPNMKQAVDQPSGVLHDLVNRTQALHSPIVQGEPVNSNGPSFKNSGSASPTNACNKSFPNSISNKTQLTRSAGSDADSDDGRSQCSTASYDASQENKGEEPERNQSERAAKKRTWKLLLTSEQACEVVRRFLLRHQFMFYSKIIHFF